MTKHVPTKTRFRPTPLAASMALLWSGAALAAPGEPELDWMETQYDLIPPATSVTLDVAWERRFGDPATSVQYRFDGHTLRAMPVTEQETQSGQTTLQLDRPGEYDFTVALCNQDGCSESVPVPVTVADAEGTFLTGDATIADLDPDEVEAKRQAIIAASAEAYAALEAKWGPRVTWSDASSAHLATVSAPSADNWKSIGSSLLGRAVLGSTFDKDVFKSSIDLVFALFTGSASSDPVADALDGIQTQLDDISKQLDAVLDQLMAIQQNAAWTAFDTQDGFVRDGVTDINTAANLIAQWADRWDYYAETGQLPTQDDYRYVKELLLEGAGKMQTHLTSTRGAIKQLVEAVDMNVTVSDLSHYWSVVLDYIDYNKGVLARSLASLRFLADHDTSPTFLSYLETTIGMVENTVRGMYAISGVPYPQVEGGKYIHAKSLDYAFAYYIVTDEVHGREGSQKPGSCGTQYQPCWLVGYTLVGGRPTFPGENAQTEGGVMRDGFDNLVPERQYAERYDPADYEGTNFRQFLEALGMPTWFNEARCWSQTDMTTGNCGSYAFHELGDDARWYRTNSGIPNDHQPHPYRKLLRGSLNLGGRLANFDPNRIDEVAFGIQDFEVEESGSTITLKMTERSDRTLVLVNAADGAQLGSTPATNPGSIVIPASGNGARAITVLSQPLVEEGAKSATFAQSSFVIDSTQAVTVDFEIEEK